MVGDRTGETFRIGDTVEVRLLEVAPVAGALRFELLSEGSRGDPSSGRRGAKGPFKGKAKPAPYRKLSRRKR
jgi:ribonuclease R